MKRLLVIALVVLAGCGTGAPTRTSAPLPSPTVTATALPAFLRVTGRPSGSVMAIVWRNGIATITSRLSGKKVTIAGTAGRYTRNGRLLAVVRNYRDGVRLNTADGRTLWEARIVGGQVQIRRGQTRVRYEFGRDPADEWIIVRQGTVVVGSVRPIEEGAVVVDAQGARLGQSSSPPGNDMAVLLCREIAPDLRAVLAAAMLPHP